MYYLNLLNRANSLMMYNIMKNFILKNNNKNIRQCYMKKYYLLKDLIPFRIVPAK